MITTSVKIRVDKDGEARIPRKVLNEIGARPLEEIEVTLTRPQTVKSHVPVKLTKEQRDKFDLALQYLQESMKGSNFAEAWKFIREGRRDRWF